MRELTYVAKDTLVWCEVEEPVLLSDFDAIVSPEVAASCELDLAVLSGQTPFMPPFPIGRTCIARVVQTAKHVRSVVAGDLVVVPSAISCGLCIRCKAGLQAHCLCLPPMAVFGAPAGGQWGGLFSELVRVPWADSMLVPLPARLDPISLVSAGDAWPLAWRLVAPHLRNRPGARVLVMSGGTTGLHVCDIAQALGAGDVLYVDPDPDRREVAALYGAATADSIEPLHHGFDLAVEVSGDMSDLSIAVRSLVPEGICESAGNHFHVGVLPLLEMFLTGVTLRVARDNVHGHIRDALELAMTNDVNPGLVVAQVREWSELPQTLSDHSLKPVYVR